LNVSEKISRASLILKIIFISVLFILIGTIIVVNIYSYDEFTLHVLWFLKSEDKLEQFRSTFLTPQKFTILRIALLILTLLYGLFIFLVRASKVVFFIGEIKKDIPVIFQNTIKEIGSLSFYEKIISICVFLFILGFHLYYFIRFPIFIDEAFTYVHFISKGFLTSAFYYPGPNNHIFYSELCVFTNLFFDDPIIVMRLPSFITGIALSFLFFMILKKYLGFQISLLSTIIFSLSEQTNFYSSQGRGYILLTFFVFLAVYSIGQFFFNHRKFYLLLFVISSVLGFYTLPVFLYPFSSMFLWSLFIIWKNRDPDLFFKIILLNSVIVALVLILYLPVLLLNPQEVIFGNTWVSSPTDFYNRFPQYLLHLDNFWWGERFDLFLSLAAFIGVVWLGAKLKSSIGIGIIFLFILPFLMIFIQKLLPFERVWLYYLLFLSVGLSYFIINLPDLLIKNPLTQKAIGIALIFVVLGFYTFINYKILSKKTFSYYNELELFLSRVDSLHVKNIQVTESDYNTFIRLHSIEKNNQIKVLSLADSIKFKGLIIIPANQQFLDSNYIFLFRNNYVKAYKPFY
jgi:hypothetical protein